MFSHRFQYFDSFFLHFLPSFWNKPAVDGRQEVVAWFQVLGLRLNLIGLSSPPLI